MLICWCKHSLAFWRCLLYFYININLNAQNLFILKCILHSSRSTISIIQNCVFIHSKICFSVIQKCCFIHPKLCFHPFENMFFSHPEVLFHSSKIMFSFIRKYVFQSSKDVRFIHPNLYKSSTLIVFVQFESCPTL